VLVVLDHALCHCCPTIEFFFACSPSLHHGGYEQ
jgi:hypothetical protein